MRKVLSFFLLITSILVIFTAPVYAATDIGNGKLFICSGTTIISVKTNTEVTPKKAIRKFKRIIRKKNEIIANSPKGSKRRKKAVRAKKAARRGLKDAKSCRDGTLGDSLVGTWNIVTENGMTPSEHGYTSLSITFTDNGFISVLVGPTNCNWQGTYSSDDNLATINVTTTVGTGGAPCSQAVGKTVPATVTFSDNGNTLTLDYRPNGTLQVFERIS